MSNSPGKYGNVREFLDNLGNEKIKICKNCGTVFSYQNETTILCLSCDFEEEVSTLPAVVEIEDEFEIAQPEPAVVAAQPTILAAEPVVAEVDIVESTTDWDMDSFDDMEAEPVVEEATELETLAEVDVAPAIETETVVEEAVEADPVVEEAVEADPVVEAVVAEPVVGAVEAGPIVEAVVAEPVVENNDMFKRPTKKVEDVIDLSKPEIQDAEMVDDED